MAESITLLRLTAPQGYQPYHGGCFHVQPTDPFLFGFA
jgi:hypothetical protein